MKKGFESRGNWIRRSGDCAFVARTLGERRLDYTSAARQNTVTISTYKKLSMWVDSGREIHIHNFSDLCNRRAPAYSASIEVVVAGRVRVLASSDKGLQCPGVPLVDALRPRRRSPYWLAEGQSTQRPRAGRNHRPGQSGICHRCAPGVRGPPLPRKIRLAVRARYRASKTSRQRVLATRDTFSNRKSRLLESGK